MKGFGYTVKKVVWKNVGLLFNCVILSVNVKLCTRSLLWLGVLPEVGQPFVGSDILNLITLWSTILINWLGRHHLSRK